MAMKADEVVQILLRERLRVSAVAATVVRDVHAADDVFQQVVLAALESLDHFREPSHVLAWAIRTARHRALDQAQRRHMRCLPDNILDSLESRWNDPSTVTATDQVEALHHCLSLLTTSARELLQMRYAGGLSAIHIARQLRRTPDAIYQSLSRIHRTLRKCVEARLLQSVNSAARGVP